MPGPCSSAKPSSKTITQQMLILLLFISLPVIEVSTTHVCNNHDLTGFCLITRQLKNIVKSKDPVVPYPQFTEIIKNFPENAFWTTEAPSKDKNNKTVEYPVLENTIFTYMDYCQLQYIYKSPSGGVNPPAADMENPWNLQVTEIYVKKKRLHNWLHFHITQTTEPKRKIKMAFIIVTDKQALPVGDFNHHIPCGSDCNCKKMTSGEPRCHQGTHEDHIPCMFTNNDVLTHPGQMMFYDEAGVDEIHATWHFSQGQFQTGSRSSFTTELHFKAILVDDLTVVTLGSIGKERSNPDNRKGICGWSPVYKLIYPTMKTLGAWDIFRRGVYDEKDVECHKLLDPTFYLSEPYPLLGTAKEARFAMENFNTSFRNIKNFVGARNFEYSFRDYGDGILPPDYTKYKGRPDRLYYGIFGLNEKFPIINKVNPVYAASGPDRVDRWPNALAVTKVNLMRLTAVTPEHLEADRCSCPELPSTQAPEYIPPPPIQIEGRKAHALQMIIAWLCLIPFGIFVSRYYKETFSKVFFLQEYWWYMTHVLCMLAGLMFMFGGIYAMSIKRQEEIKLKDKGILVHVILGSAAIGMFCIHVILGFFRFRDLGLRLVQIFLHWFFGNLEYLLAVASMLASAAIIQGGLSCGAVSYISLWILVQIGLFIGMELHMRDVDERMKLTPKRTYLPPPVMRVFHDNAPDSKFRIYILGGYAVWCLVTVFVLHMLIKFNEGGESCFKRRIIEDAHVEK